MSVLRPKLNVNIQYVLKLLRKLTLFLLSFQVHISLSDNKIILCFSDMTEYAVLFKANPRLYITLSKTAENMSLLFGQSLHLDTIGITLTLFPQFLSSSFYPTSTATLLNAIKLFVRDLLE